MKTLQTVLLALTLNALVAVAQNSDLSLAKLDPVYASLLVLRAEVPLYPQLAVAARQTGTVRVRISVKEGDVLSADSESSAPPVLVSAAKDNVRTWRFARDVNGPLEIVYVYELANAESVVPENPRVEMQLPSLVRITARPVKVLPTPVN